ncbi:RrF2 family transcriptional regulator [Synoicihabitans lomoniglobus]|uniref:Rrf2 family transcriptional regulator n=1 Tax=Synoicihabitans lomoniglobus TaxID=2909285 RepID=A0AAE9ZUM2_9BACT|nr:Rrf2 family transcriptional regulator [Opitutaceae bacterium LMO-M01]WED65445.1 Rrf2 family transcriptional regulator [Opitutaceae bacterium LMO-M01]
MKLSVKVDYACRVLAQLARSYGRDELAHIESLAKAEGVPANYLVQILSELRNGGLISSKRGKQGGYALARPPEEVTLFDIVRLIEGDVLELNGSGEGFSGAKVDTVWRSVRETLEEKCRSCTLDMMVNTSSEEMYYI